MVWLVWLFWRCLVVSVLFRKKSVWFGIRRVWFRCKVCMIIGLICLWFFGLMLCWWILLNFVVCKIIGIWVLWVSKNLSVGKRCSGVSANRYIRVVFLILWVKVSLIWWRCVLRKLRMVVLWWWCVLCVVCKLWWWVKVWWRIWLITFSIRSVIICSWIFKILVVFFCFKWVDI